MHLSVIIVNYNVKYFLEQCLFSVIKAMQSMNGEIIVVDNCSTDDSFTFFQDRFQEVRFIWNKTNEGFAKANNQALAMAKGEYILFLNPDTIVPEDCFEKCIAFINERPKENSCALGIKMLDGAGNFLKESKRAFPSPLTSFYKLSGLAALFSQSKRFGRYFLGYLDENKNHEVDVLAGAFMLIPKFILDKVGSFDEGFFMYGEDIDLSFRIQKAGYKNCYFAGSCIIHFKGESTKKGSLNYVKLFYRAMSIFVKKHYGSGRAGVFSFFIQIAILIRASLSALARLLKWIGLPVIDAGIIFLSFWLVKFIWITYIIPDDNYSVNLINIAFPVFILIFLITSYFSGLYDNGYKQSRLNKSALITVLAILSVYSLLPEAIHFSRGILVFSTLAAFIFMTLMRWILVKWKIIESAAKNGEYNQVVIAGNRSEYQKACDLLEHAGRNERIMGRIATDNVRSVDTIGLISEMDKVLQLHLIKEIVFCEGQLSFKKIIELIPLIPKHISIQLFSGGSRAIIGSDDKDVAGNFILKDQDYRLNSAIHLRSKRLFDFLFSLFLLLTFPIHIFIKKRPLKFYKNAFCVLFRKKTWVGYSTQGRELPALKHGIITTTGLPYKLNHLPEKSLLQTDKLYARHYHILYDVGLVRKNYHFLS